jgi:hypothetical protein
MGQVHLAVGPNNHPVVIFLVPGCLITIDLLSNWQHFHNGSLKHGMRAVMVRKTKWKPLGLSLLLPKTVN